MANDPQPGNSDPLIALSTPSGHIMIRGGAGSSDDYRLVGATTNQTYRYCPSSQAQTLANALEAAGAT